MTPVLTRQYRLFSGIDVAAKTFTASWTTDPPRSAPSVPFEYSDEGVTRLQQPLEAAGVAPQDTLIVLEATGSYWIRLAGALHAAGFAVSVVNPAQTH